MKELIQGLTECFGPSGYESAVRELVRKRIKPFANEIRVDTLGNLIAKKGRAGKTGKKIMLAAHMDEIGLMASHIDANGFVRFAMLGRPSAGYLPGRRVRFQNGIQGVIAHGLPEDLDKLPPSDTTYIDVGATSGKNCPIKVGDVATFDHPFMDMGQRLVAKSMDGRAGLAVLIETMRTLKSTPHEILFAFTVQVEMGTRGAATATLGLDPNIGLAVDVSAAGDTPDSFNHELALGRGPAIKIRDPSMLAHPMVVSWMERTARKAGIPCQREVAHVESTDARAIQLTGGGVAVGGMGIPCRYAHSAAQMIDYRDLQNCVRLLRALLSAPVAGWNAGS